MNFARRFATAPGSKAMYGGAALGLFGFSLTNWSSASSPSSPAAGPVAPPASAAPPVAVSPDNRSNVFVRGFLPCFA
jgi:hypothetical protein